MTSNPKAFFWPIITFSAVIIALSLFSFDSGLPEKDMDAKYQDHIEENYKVFSLATPEDVTFGGVEVPLDKFGVKEKLDRELLVNTYWHSNSFLVFKRANRWFPIIEPILAKNNIPDDFKYLAVIESGLTNAVSPAGARGFWQFMDATGKSYGLEISNEVDERYDVLKATQAACEYLQNSYDKYGDWALVAASYNMGMGGVNAQLNKQQVESYWDLMLNSETGRYVYRILAVKEILNNGSNYGFVVRPKDLYQPYKTRTVTVDSTIDNLADFALEHDANYNILKTLNPWLTSNSLRNKSRKEYQVLFPAK